MSKNVFVLGITGYIGGSVYTTIRAAYPSYSYTALVRSSSHFPAVSAVGATPVLGSFSDHDTIKRLASEADIVLNCADADDVGLTEAVLEGFRKRKEEGKGVGILVHTSGTAVFGYVTNEGKFGEGTKMWTDAKIEDIKAITPEKAHGQVDVPILRAAAAGDVYSYIISPSAIHGVGTGPVARASSFTKLVAGGFAQLGRAIYVGEGSNVFGFIHLSDLTALYLLVFNHAVSNYPPTTSPYERYYIASTESLSWKTIGALYGASLHKRGLIPSSSPVQVTFEEAGPFATALGLNSVTDGKRGKELGWTPKGPKFEESLERDIDLVFPSK